MLDLLMTLFAVGSGSSLEQMVGMLCTPYPWDTMLNVSELTSR